MENDLLHIWILSFQSPSQNASDNNSVLNWLKLDKTPCLIRTWRDDFYEDGPEIQSTAEMSELLLSWYACHSLSLTGYGWWLTWKPDKRGTLISHSFLWTKLVRITGEAIQSTEVAFSAVIREFKHSTSLQDDTSLNSLSTHCLLAHVTWFYDKLPSNH